MLRYLRWQEPSAADDLAGETWLAFAEHLEGFSGDERSMRAWMFSIARRRLADHRRTSGRRQTTAFPAEHFDRRAGGVDPGELSVDTLSAQDAITRITAGLPHDQAEVIVLRVVGGLSVEETAGIISKRPGTVRVLQHRALKRLAGILAPGDVSGAFGG
ncbi:MAG: RNA polymerase sigma factor [Acidimicrobiales bacterium]